MRPSRQPRSSRTRLTFWGVVACSLTIAALPASSSAQPTSEAAADPSDPAVEVTDAWWVTGPETFPDDDAMLQAQRPSITETSDGDLLVTFNTTGDAHPGGQLRMIRSTDDGLTWGPSEIVAEPFLHGPNGSIAAQRGIATLADGTILLPYNDAINHRTFDNRESALFVAASTDDGVTWTGRDAPITLPQEIREAHVAGTAITTLADGTLILPIWGAHRLSPTWQTYPEAWQSGVLRSFDGGETWSDYSVVAHDPDNPRQYAPVARSRYPSGANEFAVQELPDGRLLAVIRYATAVGSNQGQSYVSYSADQGATWSDPVPMGPGMDGVGAEALSVTAAPCTDRLPTGRSKLLMGHRVLSPAGERIGRAAVRVSFDDGVTWGAPAALQAPDGDPALGSATGEPTFHRLNDHQVLVLFQVFRSGTSRIVANVLEDAATDADCQGQLAEADDREQILIYAERADRDQWPWPLATTARLVDPDAPVGDVLDQLSAGVSCAPVDPLVRRRGSTAPLNLTQTLSSQGIDHGDVLVIDDAQAPSADAPRVGHNELDVHPDTHPIYAWNDTCDYGVDLDARARGLGIDLGEGGGVLRQVELWAEGSTSRLDPGDPVLRAEGGLVPDDVDPATGLLEFGETGSLAVDFRRRSVGLAFDEPVTVEELQLTARGATSRLEAEHYSLWVSEDGTTYTEVADWDLDAQVVDGRLVHTFSGFSETATSLKVNTSFTDGAYTFVLDSYAQIVARGSCPDDACLQYPSPYAVFQSDDNVLFEPVDQVEFGRRIEDGRLVHTLHGLSIDARYVKITQPYLDDAPTFRIASLREDVRVDVDQPSTAPDLQENP